MSCWASLLGQLGPPGLMFNTLNLQHRPLLGFYGNKYYTTHTYLIHIYVINTLILLIVLYLNTKTYLEVKSSQI